MPTFEKFNYFEVALDKIKSEIKKYCIVIIPKKNQTVFNLGPLSHMDVRIRNEIKASGFALVAMPDHATALDMFNKILTEYYGNFPAFILTDEKGEPVQCIPKDAIEKKKKKFLAVIEGVGEGCDYTIGCNQTTNIVEAEDATAAFTQILEYFGDTNFREWKSPESFKNEPEFRIDTITLYDITATNPIKMNSCFLLSQEYLLYKDKLLKDPEYQEYVRLKQKFK